MNDSISRQAAIDKLKSIIADREYTSITDEAKERIARKFFADIPSAQRWIPCSERLPEVHESGNSFSGIFMQSYPVLVYGICEFEENAQFHVVTYCDELDGNTYWSTELDALTITEVKAWMPLPEPYKGEE